MFYVLVVLISLSVPVQWLTWKTPLWPCVKPYWLTRSSRDVQLCGHEIISRPKKNRPWYYK